MHDFSQKDRGREEGIEALVRRYGDLVYAAALRRMGGDASGAEDVAQVVMMIVVAKGRAGKLPEERVMAGWLIKVTGYAVKQAKRAAARRAKHEGRKSEVRSEESEVQEGVRRELDEALLALAAVDREVVVRRYLQGESFAEVGRAVGMSENTAGRRGARALEKLRGILMRRGVTAPVGVIAGGLGVEAGVKAPAACAAGVVLAGTGAASAGTGAAILKGTMLMIAAEKVKIGVVAVVVIFLAIGGVVMTTKIVGGGGGEAGPVEAARNVTGGSGGEGRGGFDGTVTFSDGTVVELLGVHWEGAGSPAGWWGVDGLPCVEPPHEAEPRIHMNTGPGERVVRVMMRMPGQSASRKGIQVKLVPSERSRASSYTRNGGTMIEAVGVVKEGQKTAEMQVGVAGGAWVRDVVYDVATGRMGASATGKAGIGKVEISEEGDEACVTVTGLSISPELDGEFLAVVGGRTVHPDHGSESKMGMSNYYRCAAGAITEVVLQTRRFEVVRVENVSLVPTVVGTGVRVAGAGE
ncbi:MAG: RNA polymerase sigma factor [Phycisphaerae bacterium]